MVPTAKARAKSGAPAVSEASGAGDGPDEGRGRRDGWLTTGEMARVSNNTLRTVRFYEEAGILSPVRRTDGGHRLFEKTELDKLMLVTDMRAAGMSLEDIRTLLETKQRATTGGDAAREAVDALTGRLDELKEKIATLTRLYDDLAHTVDIANGCLNCKEMRGGETPAPEGASLFPDRCHECGKLTAQGPAPRGMRVLWSLRATADADDND